MKFHFFSIRWKLFVAVGVPLFLIYISVLGTVYYELRKTAYENMNKQMTALAGHYAEELDNQLTTAAQVAKTSAAFLSGNVSLSDTELYQLLTENVAGNPHLYGSAAAFEEGAFRPDLRLFSPYAYRDLSKTTVEMLDGRRRPAIRQMDIATDAYDYRNWDWYKVPRETGKGAWTEPYFDKGAGNVIMCTFSAPIIKNGKFRGVITVDIRVQDLQNFLDPFGPISKDAFAIISRQGRYISHPKPEYVIKETIFSNATLTNRPELHGLGRKMLTGERGSILIRDFNSPQKIFMFYAPITSTGWSFAATIHEEEVMRPVWGKLMRFAVLMLAGLLFMAVLLLIIAGKITKPVIALSRTAQKLGLGNFDIVLEGRYDHDEIGALADSFKKMARDLKSYTEALARETSARQKVESELQLARNIQLSLLPRTFPDRKEFELYGKNDPARFVAGDFFDFFFVGNDTLAFTIADVSGKGISAAMFMVMTRTLVRNLASKNLPPEQVLSETNRLLYEQNENGMFVTLFFGYLNIRTGEVRYANAGHYPPVHLSGDGTIRKFGAVTGAPLGIENSLTYGAATDVILPGETIVMYTDGFPEARNPSGEFLNETGFHEALKNHRHSPVKDFCEKVFRHATDFQQQKLHDDLTLLILRRFI